MKSNVVAYCLTANQIAEIKAEAKKEERQRIEKIQEQKRKERIDDLKLIAVMLVFIVACAIGAWIYIGI